MNQEKRFCLHCEKPIQGRLDKKFCDDSCRNTYNNQQNAVNVNLIRNINHTLKKNRNILGSLIPPGEVLVKTTREKLRLAGFNFKFFTHTYQNKKGNNYHYCYDYGYLALDGDWYLIVRGKEF
jgi:predicted nucleic acid-binding Zn ribbon protein